MRITIPFVIGVALSFFSIKSQAQNCVATLTAGNSCTNTVPFTNQSTPTVMVHYNWVFGDGTANSTQTNPSHTFPNAGNYTVCLSIEAAGCVTESCQTVGVGGDTQEPGFSSCRIASRPVNTDPGQCDAVVNLSGIPAPTATDNCDNSLTYSRSPSGNVFPIGETVVTITATDDAGNSASCDYLTVKVSDREPPVFDCSETNYMATPHPGQCYATLTREDIEPPSSDNCGIQTVTQSGFPTNRHFPIGITKVTFIARDDAGNRDTCIVNVEVKDDIPPTLICPRDISITASAHSSGTTVRFSPPTLADNCSTVTYVFTPANGSFFVIGTTPVVVKATDAAGSSTTCTYKRLFKNYLTI